MQTFETLHLGLRCLLKYLFRGFRFLKDESSNETRKKHPTSFRLSFYVFKQLLRDCSDGKASRSRQNVTLLALRQINIDTDVSEYDQEILQSHTADQPTAP